MSKQTKTTRRSFFAGLGLAAGAAVAARLMQEQVEQPVSAGATPSQDERYRLTEHIRKYYRSTTI